MPLDLFGFRIEKKPDELTDKKSVKSFVAPDNYDGAFTVEAGGILGTHIDFAGSMRDENTLINRYRSMAMYPEVDNAVEDIVNDSIVLGTDKKPVYVELENVELSENIKNKIFKKSPAVRFSHFNIEFNTTNILPPETRQTMLTFEHRPQT